MAQLDVHRNLIEPSDPSVPYLLDVQADVLRLFDVRVVVPLLPATHFRHPIHGLNPGFEIEGVIVVMATQFIAGTSTSNLGEIVTSLRGQRAEIIGALDLLITGV
jgi:toxin CcdB